jgi:Tfp pilus assembly protein PilZ
MGLPEEAAMPDNRPTQKHPRVAVEMPARISTIDSETDPLTGKPFFRTSQETCANVSKGGAFVATRETIPAGRRVLLELEIPGGRRVQAIGRVAWTKTTLALSSPAGKGRQAGIGVEFVGGPRDQLLEIEKFVARSIRRRRPDDPPSTGHKGAERR